MHKQADIGGAKIVQLWIDKKAEILEGEGMDMEWLHKEQFHFHDFPLNIVIECPLTIIQQHRLVEYVACLPLGRFHALQALGSINLQIMQPHKAHASMYKHAGTIPPLIRPPACLLRGSFGGQPLIRQFQQTAHVIHQMTPQHAQNTHMHVHTQMVDQITPHIFTKQPCMCMPVHVKRCLS